MTVFFRLLKEEDKGAALAAAIEDFNARRGVSDPSSEGGDRRCFVLDPASFRQVPNSPFCYWVSDRIRRLFRELPPFEAEGRTVKQGLATADDFRFVRAWWEAPAERILDGRNGPDWREDEFGFQEWCRNRTFQGKKWVPFAKGGEYSPYYADLHLVVNWEKDGAEIRNFVHPKTGKLLSRPQNTDFYFRPGLTWPRRTTSGISIRNLPAGAIFADKGPVAFVNAPLACLGIMQSSVFQELIGLQLAAAAAAARSYEVGLIQKVPFVEASPEVLHSLVSGAISTKVSIRSFDELEHHFVKPGLLASTRQNLRENFKAWIRSASKANETLDKIRKVLDEIARCIYMGKFGDIEHLDLEFENDFENLFGESFQNETDASLIGNILDNTEFNGETIEKSVGDLISYCLGCALGRWIPCSAQAAQELLDASVSPFAPLPVCSPALLSNENDAVLEDLPARSSSGILVDDPGHPDDVVARIGEAFDALWGDRAHDVQREAVEILDAKAGDLRPWLRRQFFSEHIKRYSKSRRKAPVDWQLATPSSSYSVWLYCHRFTRDTLYKVLNDYATPKLRHEERRLAGLRQRYGPEPSTGQRKEIAAQEAFVEELSHFRDEIARIAPLWNPDLDDGVIINFAPLWRLVPQHKSWQKECKACWDRLVKGDHDWSRLAMHLWPERVVPKCVEDRSLALAHDLEEVLWEQVKDGKWRKRDVSEKEVRELIEQRTSPSVRAALEDLLSAPAAGSSPRRGSKKVQEF